MLVWVDVVVELDVVVKFGWCVGDYVVVFV